ncbi:hypothetical protein OSB04_002360 [Centaurea solstitialis]|uniref:Serine-threonine/tyrosine-protein kinase catalytic domain-containing protein n=1 Tax=Centaurea solstitialis TaxID=347529 RepID=A0AA38TUL1_9ASTR|nr:hypothetical protein OSB04_002360 [Centaurea solstitialis]
MSRLRHPNIVPLAGYCAEHEKRLLVYDYIANWSLQDLLHFADDLSKTSRVRYEQSLATWATPQLPDIDSLAKMIDLTLNGMYLAKSLSRFVGIISLCVHVNSFV